MNWTQTFIFAWCEVNILYVCLGWGGHLGFHPGSGLHLFSHHVNKIFCSPSVRWTPMCVHPSQIKHLFWNKCYWHEVNERSWTYGVLGCLQTYLLHQIKPFWSFQKRRTRMYFLDKYRSTRFVRFISSLHEYRINFHWIFTVELTHVANFRLHIISQFTYIHTIKIYDIMILVTCLMMRYLASHIGLLCSWLVTCHHSMWVQANLEHNTLRFFRDKRRVSLASFPPQPVLKRTFIGKSAL